MIFDIFFGNKSKYNKLLQPSNSESNSSSMKPTRSRGGAREQIALKNFEAVDGHPTHYII